MFKTISHSVLYGTLKYKAIAKFQKLSPKYYICLKFIKEYCHKKKYIYIQHINEEA